MGIHELHRTRVGGHGDEDGHSVHGERDGLRNGRGRVGQVTVSSAGIHSASRLPVSDQRPLTDKSQGQKDERQADCGR